MNQVGGGGVGSPITNQILPLPTDFEFYLHPGHYKNCSGRVMSKENALSTLNIKLCRLGGGESRALTLQVMR